MLKVFNVHSMNVGCSFMYITEFKNDVEDEK